MKPNPSIIQIFNRYQHPGGEEASVDRVFRSISSSYFVHQCLFDSRDWQGPGAPSLPAQALRMWRNPEALARIRSDHEAHQTNVWLLHNLFPVASAGVYALARKMDVPTIQYIHNFRPFSVNGYLWANNRIETAGLKKNFWPEIRAGAWQHSKIKTAWYAAILTALHRSGAFKRVNAWIAISEFMKTTFVEAGIPESKVHVIRHSWEFQVPMLESFLDKGYYLFMGRLSQEKGVTVLLDVWDRLEKDLQQKTPHLVLCGEGPLAEEVQIRARANSHIRFEGRVVGDHKQSLIRECRAMLAPSLWWEPLGLVTYEAYEHCKPMLAAASGGLTETVKHDQSGYLHEPGDLESLMEQILSLESDPGKAAKMGQQGRKWLESFTSNDQWRDQFNRVLSTL